MKRTVLTDPFFDKQPPLAFIDELKKPLHAEKPEYYGKRNIRAGEADARGIYINEFYSCTEEEDGLLDTVYHDFSLFTKVYGIDRAANPQKTFPINIVKGKTECFEAYTVEVSDSGVTVTSDDTEGARRALIYIEDELRRRENAFLPIGTVKRKPVIHSRITRCFFSPINRPPKYGDELSDDIDYYPDEYLNRLMHDGANGVWIYTRFSDILPSSYIAEYGKGYEARIAKLNRVIDKCARYGIGVYVFAIEPAALTPELAAKYPEAAGSMTYDGKKTLCMNSDFGRKYCYEAGKTLTKLCPKLKGFISITDGERSTSCSSVSPPCGCPRCRGENRGKLLSKAVEALRSGIREINPKCEVVSWTYGHRLWRDDDIRSYVESAPDDVMLMQNFDDMGYEEQLGKRRLGADYWLSYIGPSDLFKVTAKKANECGKHMFAKMQVCCSHEIASIPYIPTPGNIFRKYAAAKKYGVEGIMQCWYFGNYPSLMSKAAGELAFEEISDLPALDEDGFLKSLAAVYWGESRAESVAKAWKKFGEGYSYYPLNIMFSYYGPAHDSVVWKLALKPKNFSLPRTWQTIDPVDGDRICEALLTGHTLEEAYALLRMLCSSWNEGMSELEKFSPRSSDEAEQLSVAKAISILFDGTKNILEFYLLRDNLGAKKGDPEKTLSRMKELTELEIKNSEKMIPLCENDARLGYHSEGEGYKFFPEKLRDRISQLKELLETEFPEVGERAAKGLSPLEYYDGVEEDPEIKVYRMEKGSLSSAKREPIDAESGSFFKMSYDDKNLYIGLESEKAESFMLCPEYKLMCPDANVIITPEGEARLEPFDRRIYYSLLGEREKLEYAKYADIRKIKPIIGEGTSVVIRLKLADIGLAGGVRPMKMRILAGGKSWCRDKNHTSVASLGKFEVRTGEYGWIIPEQ